jgi:dienelactone hydrolase
MAQTIAAAGRWNRDRQPLRCLLFRRRAEAMERRADIAWISRNRRFAAPVLGLYGAEDASITPDQVEAMKEKLKAAGKTTKFKIYPGADHGFFADYGQSYRADAAQDAWMAMQAWFKKYKVLD